jgi:carboxylesterase type B
LRSGLFTKVIAQSGAALDEWTIDYEPVYNAKGIAKAAGCDDTAPEADLVKCLKDMDALTLIEAYKNDWKVSILQIDFCFVLYITPNY